MYKVFRIPEWVVCYCFTHINMEPLQKLYVFSMSWVGLKKTNDKFIVGFATFPIFLAFFQDTYSDHVTLAELG